MLSKVVVVVVCFCVWFFVFVFKYCPDYQGGFKYNCGVVELL